ncbi:MAG: RNA polymerase factor sigma-54 [Bacteroidaceae bacterium]|nr:RNA polymerase factor sigma-54 [Bacteroidaceae bacterium]
MAQQRLQQEQKLQQRLSPQQIQLMRLLELNEPEMEERVKQELVENPALEEGVDPTTEDKYNTQEGNFDEEGYPVESSEQLSLGDYYSEDDIPDYRFGAHNYSPDDNHEQTPIGAGSSFHEFLTEQLAIRHLNDTEHHIAEYIIGNIDDNGYLQRTLDAISDDLIFQTGIDVSTEEIAQILSIIQDFEPAGVGATTLQECLLLQLERRSATPSNMLAYRIIKETFDAFTKKHYDKIIKQLDITEEELRNANHEINSLNPKPGSAWSDNDTPTEQITPDFEVYEQDGSLVINHISGNIPSLTVSRQYKEMLEDYNASKSNRTRERRDALLFVKQKLDAAQWFVNAVRQRQKTLLDTITAIVELQQDFFFTGMENDLRPMVLRDIAQKTGYDISTISRATSTKYVQTSFGVYPLKHFFSEGMQNTDGDEVSTREIKHILQQCIESEDKSTPLSDDRLSELLHQKGYPIARRTVAKYREQLGIPVARLRRKI